MLPRTGIFNTTVYKNVAYGLKIRGITRAMVINPEVFMLDEPTANIDPANTAIIEDIILKMKQERQATILIITHDPAQAQRLGDDLLFMQDGKIIPA